MLRVVVAVISAVMALLPGARPAVAESMHAGFVSVQGKRFIGPDGQTFKIKGINLGNWLIHEGYMFKFEHAKSPHEINDVIVFLCTLTDGSRVHATRAITTPCMLSLPAATFTPAWSSAFGLLAPRPRGSSPWSASSRLLIGQTQIWIAARRTSSIASAASACG